MNVKIPAKQTPPMSLTHNHESAIPTHETRELVMESVRDSHSAWLTSLQRSQSVQQAIATIAHDKSITLPNDPFTSREQFWQTSKLVLDFRGGASARKDMASFNLSEASLDAIDDLRKELEMDVDTLPENKHPDLALIPANYGRNTKARFEYLDSLINDTDDPLHVAMIVFPSSDRPVHAKPDANGETEIDQAGAIAYSLVRDTNGQLVQGEQAQTEHDLSMNIIQHRYGVTKEEMTTISGTDRSVPEAYHFQADWEVSYVEAEGKTIFELSTPMSTPNRYYELPNKELRRRERPNTNDNLAMVAAMLQDTHHEDGSKPTVLMATESIYKFQNVIASCKLAQQGIHCETIGVSRETAGLPPYTGDRLAYAQELLSLINALNNSLDELDAALKQSYRNRGHAALDAVQIA